MRRTATAMLFLMAGIFVLAHNMEEAYPAWGFVRAFAEAAMVGGLADWFAVTALFRHPMGIPIPHTAIVPRKKDQIGEQLAWFLRDNFLTPAVVARRMKRFDVAGAIGNFLTNPEGGKGRMRRSTSKLIAMILENLDDERLGGATKAMIANRLRELNVAPLLGQSMVAAMREDRHVPIVDGIVRWVANILDSNEEIVRAMVYERANNFMRWLAIDDRLSDAIINGLRRLLVQMEGDPHHPLRDQANEGFVRLAFDLQHDDGMKARVEQFKLEMIDNPAVTEWLDGLWKQARESLLRTARDPDREMAGRFREALQELGRAIQDDPEIKGAINSFTRRATVGAAADYGDSIVKFVSETVKSWDADTITERIENAVSRDLQYIRMNGTLVGGLVGLTIHTIITIV